MPELISPISFCSAVSCFCSTMASTWSVLTPSIDAAHDASVAEGIGRLGGEDGHGRARWRYGSRARGDGLRTDERHVAAEHEHVIVGGERLAALHHRVPGAALLKLLDELRSERRDFGADARRPHGR